MIYEDHQEQTESMNAAKRERLRFEAACHAMQGILSNPNVRMYTENIVEDSVKAADELLYELNK